ncbi:threonine/serine exporter family protein [Facklamia sp. 7083-14-GEN3]|uniref:threonine/serine exporter family protein n=1 Tax=Facklamia sp. 7083-14-GEN3 TaxID=2973478 RepID=UPI00215CB7C5|nr:threonine/serine exporter family protein [Facklamia sp. 7083-14-GEN3]MCR8968547.1 threonine/serine exporter family protein [Facklamia sp. 7083-14-GEN3]
MELNHLILRLIASYLATVAAAINVNAPRKFIYWSGIPGIISYAVYLFVLSLTNTFIATFIGSLIVSIIGQWMSRKFKTVVNVFYIPAFFLYVPGIAIYETAEYFMENNLIAASQSFYQALVTALAIGLAVFVVDSAMDTYKYHLNKRTQSE